MRKPWELRCPACRAVVGVVTRSGDLALTGDAVDVLHDDEDDTRLFLVCRNRPCEREWELTIRPGQAVTWRLSPRKAA